MRYTSTDGSERRPTLEQWYKRSFVQRSPRSCLLRLDKISVQTANLSPVPEAIAGPQARQHTFIHLLEGSTRRKAHIEGRNYQTDAIPGNLLLVPHFTEHTGSWDKSVKIGLLHFSHSVLAELLGSDYPGDPDRIEFIPQHSLYDPFLRLNSAALYNALEVDDLLDTLLAESLVNPLLIYLIKNYSTASASLKTPSGCLTSLQISRVDDYIHAHIDQKISVSDLANSIHMGLAQFERAFRTTLRVSPYHHVLECKIDLAKTLLARTTAPIVDVACDCGFANQSHFTKHFSKMVGLSPAQFRHQQQGK